MSAARRVLEKRWSGCAEAARERERERVRALSMEERIIEALAMARRMSPLAGRKEMGRERHQGRK